MRLRKYTLLAIPLIALLLIVWIAKKPQALPVSTIGQDTDTVHFSFNTEQWQSLDDLSENYAKKKGFNGVVLVGQKDSVFFTHVNGLAKRNTHDSLTIHSSFQLASVSKQFTAVAILQLYAQGKLNLSDSLQTFFPDFPYEGITVHHLLVHRSGLPNYHYFLQHIPTTYDTLLSNTDLVRELVEKKPAKYFSPNRRFQYSNTGYALLAAIVEKVSGLSFTDYMQRNVFDPLSMENTFIYRADAKDYPPMVTGYLTWRKEAEDNYLDGVLGDKGVYSSAYDLFLWDQALYKGSILPVDTLALAFQAMGKPLSAHSNYGYGWRMFYWGVDSLKVDYHYGWWHGFRSMLLRIPEDTTTVVLLKNSSKGAMMKAGTVLQILYPQNDTVQQELDSTLVFQQSTTSLTS